MENKKYNKATQAVWAGEDNPYFKEAVTTPIVNSVAFAYNNLDKWYDISEESIETLQIKGLNNVLRKMVLSSLTRPYSKYPKNFPFTSFLIMCADMVY